MLGMLMFVVVAIKFAARPSSWYWLTGPPQDGASAQSGAELSPDRIDFSVRTDDDDPLPPGAFRSRRIEGPGEEASAAATGPAAEDASSPIAVDPRLIESIENNTVGVRSGELPAYYSLLAKARDLPLTELEQGARDDLGFAVLMVDSRRLLGELVTVEGYLKRLTRVPAGPNEFGIEDLYEAWFFTPDSGNNPFRFVSTSAPSGIPLGEDLENQYRVRATGYFFKRFGYATEHGLHVAPLLIGNRLRHIPVQQSAGEPDVGLIPYIVGIVSVIGISLAFLLWRFTVSDRAFQENHLRRLAAAPDEALQALDDLETNDIHDVLRQLERAESTRDDGNTA